jgi:hydroxypyruvate reductase
VAHRQVRAALAARPDWQPLVSVGTEDGPEPWALAGNHPLPGPRSFAAGEALLHAARAAGPLPFVLFLSGGGSALAEVPAPGLSGDDVTRATSLLLRSGLDIAATNAIRRRLSALKDGGLARAAPDSAWTVFALSDLPHPEPAVLSSGPCTPDPSSPTRARRRAKEEGLLARLPPRVKARLEAPSTVAGPLPKVDFQWLAGARELALAGAAAFAEEKPEVPATVLAPVAEPVEALAQRYALWALERVGSGPALLVAAGEPTLRVTGDGLGGRAQHLALLVARLIDSKPITFLAAGTDGRDGPTDHAGAIVDGGTATIAGSALERALAGFDSARLHAALGTALARRPATTHLGELHLLLVR